MGPPGDATVSETEVGWVAPPPEPVTVIGYVPVGVVEPTSSRSVEVPPPGAGTEGGSNDAVVPLGTPLAESATSALNPPLVTVVMVTVSDAPGAIVSDGRDEEIEKSGELVQIGRASCRERV